jgi:hypothetical protein
VKLVNKNTEFFTTENPDIVLEELIGYFFDKGCKTIVADGKYKIKVQQSIYKELDLEYTIRILKATHDKYCVEFNRNGGDQLEFFK